MNKSENKWNANIRRNRKLLSAILTAALITTQLPMAPKAQTAGQETMGTAAAADAVTLSNPRIVPDDTMEAGQKVTWDCVWFGSYPQAEVITTAMGSNYTAIGSAYLQEGDLIVDDAAYAALESATGWDANGDITVNGSRYRRLQKSDATYATSGSSPFYNWSDSSSYHYFKYQPVKWRVLSTDGNQALLLSDVALDDQQYNTEWTDTTWETSTLRSWLNGYGASSNNQSRDYSDKNFMDSAFSSEEQAAIINTPVENADNLTYGTEGGSDTTDKLFCLSESEVYGMGKAAGYGFALSESTYDEARRAGSSTYAKAMGAWWDISTKYEGNSWWWLRSPGYNSYNAMNVDYNGYVNYSGNIVIYRNNGVRAALNLNLLSPNLYSYAGTVCSDGTDTEVGGQGSPNPSPSASPEASPSVSPSMSPSASPEASPSVSPSVLPSASPETSPLVSPGTQPEASPSPSPVTAPTVPKVKSLKAKAGKQELTITWKEVSEAAGYQIQVSTDKNFKGAKTADVSSAKTRYVAKKLKRRKKYYVRIRACKTYTDSGNVEQTAYGKWTKTGKKTK